MSTFGFFTFLFLLLSAYTILLNVNSVVSNEPVLAPLRRFDTLTRSPSVESLGHSEDQISMQSLINHVERKKIFIRKSGEWADACLWANVFCNENLQVTRISWSKILSPVKLGSGSIDLSCLPPNVEYFDIGHTDLEGSLEAGALPGNIRELHINYCRFSGTIEWAALPQSLQILNIGSNQFTGDVALNDMPENLFQLNISKNRFESVTGDLYDNAKLKRNRIVGIKEISKTRGA